MEIVHGIVHAIVHGNRERVIFPKLRGENPANGKCVNGGTCNRTFFVDEIVHGNRPWNCTRYSLI